MPFWETVRLALDSMRGNAFRAALTMLGVIIGVAAVIAMLALGRGAQAAVDEQLASLGADVLTVTTGMRWLSGVARDQQTLTFDDAEALARDARHLSAVVPEQSGRQQVRLGARNVNISVVGTSPAHPRVLGYEVEHGRVFTAMDDATRRRVAVLGGEVPELLEVPAAGLVGATIVVKNVAFEVVGIYRRKGAVGYGNPDDDVYIPLETSRFRITGEDVVQTHLGAGRAGQRPRRRHGRDRARAPARARPCARPRQRLHAARPPPVPGDAAGDDADPRLPARRHRRRQPRRRRHRHHEHHAGDGHRAHARDRHPQGDRRDARRHPACSSSSSP